MCISILANIESNSGFNLHIILCYIIYRMSETIDIDGSYYVIGSKDRFVYKFQNTVSLEVE